MKHFIIVLAISVFCVFSLAAQEKGTLKVAEAKLGKDVQNREIVNEDSTFTLNDRVYFWMKVVGGKSDSLTVTWKTGANSSSTTLNIGGSPWRTWSYRTAAFAGDWTVTVTDAAGTVLKEMNFSVKAAVAK